MREFARALRRDILDQRTAQRDVHHLHAATDAQQRLVFLRRPPGERNLHAVAVAVYAAGLLVLLFAKQGRINVIPAGQQHSVSGQIQLAECAVVERRGHQQRRAARGDDALHIVLAQRVAPAFIVLNRDWDEDAGFAH
jgi:hypothetical protein